MLIFLLLIMAQGIKAPGLTLDEVPFSNWLSYLSDSRVVDIPIIPGSHNSGSHKISLKEPLHCRLMYPWARQQHLSIWDQLSAGVRFLDFRLHVIDGSAVRLSHRFDTSYLLEIALKEVKRFLAENSSEFVVLYLRIDFDNPLGDADSDKNLLERILVESDISLANLDGEKLSETLVQEVAGKAIILTPADEVLKFDSKIPRIDSRRYYSVQDIWRCRFANGSNGGKELLKQYVCAPYEPKPGFRGMAIDMTSMLTPAWASPSLNEWFFDNLKDNPGWRDRLNKGPIGVLLFDFADMHSTAKIIQFNLSRIGVGVTLS